MAITQQDREDDAAGEVEYLASLRAIQAMGIEAGHWQGIPMPIKELRLHVQNRHPFRDELEAMGYQSELDEDGMAAAQEAGEETVSMAAFRACWYSRARRCHVYVYDAGDPPRAKLWTIPQKRSGRALTMAIKTLAASKVWDTAAEWTAMEKLQGLVSGNAWRSYVLTGGFLETSPRSQVTYFFRKLRPTLALRPEPDGETMRILCALCLHPLAYYGDSWAGTMVPTDDVIAHLLLMRGDEPRFWRYANQHDPESLSAGLVA